MSGKEIVEFDSAYKDLVSSICSENYQELPAKYSNWLSARETLVTLIVQLIDNGQLEQIAIVDNLVMNSFESLNGSEKELIEYYPKYLKAFDDAANQLCSKDIITKISEASSIKLPIVPGVSIDVKKLLGAR